MTVLEKIKRCVSLVWDFQEIYGEEDIEEFCRNELRTYPQHDEIMEYFKRIENLEKENSEIKSELAKKADTNHSLVEQMADLESKNAELKSEKGCETCTKFDEVQLKTRKLLKCWLGNFYNPKAFHLQIAELVEQSEQFLKEIEK